MDYIRLYNMKQLQDRRQQVIPVNADRRSGIDRRTGERLIVDPTIKKDINFTQNLFKDFTPDVFVKSSAQASNPLQVKQAEKINPVAISPVKTDSFENKKALDKKDEFIAETALSAIGAGIGLSLPLFAGISSPLIIAALTIVGMATGSVLAAKAIDFYNYNNNK